MQCSITVHKDWLPRMRPLRTAGENSVHRKIMRQEAERGIHQFMEIIAGKARGMNLISPSGADTVRPTAVRARRAFFDSLGEAISGCVFADLFAGSGAMGLEAASRGASCVFFFERSPQAWKVLNSNCTRAAGHGVETEFRMMRESIPPFRFRDPAAPPHPDFVFADPPYAESMMLLRRVTEDQNFLAWARDAVVFWELPDTAYQLEIPGVPWRVSSVRDFGSARFLALCCPDS